MQDISFEDLTTLFSLVLDHVPIGVVILDQDLRLRFINQRHAQNNRLTASEQLGKRPSEFIPDIASIIEPKLRFVIEHGIPLLNQEIHGKTGQENSPSLHRLANYYPWKNSSGQILGVIGIIQDSQVDQFSQKMLEESELRLLNVLDNLFTFVGVLELDGTLSHANKAPLDAAGICIDDVRGKKVWDCFWFEHDAHLQGQMQQCVQRALRGQVSRLDMQVRMRDGQLMWIDFMMAPLRDSQGNITHLIPSGNDISQRHHDAEALKISESRFHSIVDSSDEAIISKNLDGIITAWNPAAERLLGYTEIEALGKKVTLLFPPGKVNEERALLERIGKGEHISPFETMRVHKDGHLVEVSVTISPLRDQHGNIIGACKLARDISLSNKQKAQIQRSLEEKTSLLHEVHHRVKNNLQIVSSLLNMQARKVSDDAAQAINECQIRIRSMALVHQLLYESENLSNVDLCEYLQQLITLTKISYQDQDMPIEMEFIHDNEIISLDVQRAIPCGLIVSELLLNAMKHAFKLSQAGKVRVHLVRNDAESNQVVSTSSRVKSSYITLTVSDNGCGLPANFVWGGRKSLGAQLIPMFVQQLDATLQTTSSTEGAMFTIQIPERDEGADYAN
ncbi:PAS domain S-box protein [Undibacterium seohonense]|uniref:histidine kinase n=1 Tax=Undibacterium seohonense TaxID=1344950 RepID=A0ABR6X3B7_9BURK|nr:PAS domain S-box protein [Undibacterium seohonense]MBC3807438.1 PAS domain S-box protein [Undibacterium seohonense]